MLRTSGSPCPLRVCAVRRRRSPVGARPTRQIAPAGSNRSSHGGNEMAYMSSTESRVFSAVAPDSNLSPANHSARALAPPKRRFFRILGMIASPAWPRSAVNPRSPKGRALCARD
jgi:hypothetical protein